MSPYVSGPTIRLVLVCIVLMMAAPVSARSVLFTVDGGLSLQAGSDGFKDNWQDGWNAATGIAVELGENVSLIGRMEYHRFGIENDSPYDWGDLQAFLIGFSTKIAFFDTVDPYRPYLLVGYGTSDIWLSVDPEDRGEINEYDGDDLRGYFQIGGGIEIPLTSELKLTFEGRYINIRGRFGGEATSFMPLTVGVQF